MPDAQTMTLLLRDLSRGDKQAFDRLIPLVYAELRRIASAQLRSERPGHTLQPTALYRPSPPCATGTPPRRGSTVN
ncbi:MAG TPA: ECF-type sigma factor [Candidatus Sulfotelmatobacter sp.]|nr:ECF-type sigma factor [Candidatus Sulfotelmatobacter sp.]